MATSQRRKTPRVVFEKAIDVFIMGIDGTWRRDCSMEDVSQTGASRHKRRLIWQKRRIENLLLFTVSGTYPNARHRRLDRGESLTMQMSARVGNAPSVPMLTDDSQIGSDLRFCADEEDRTDFDQRR
jgi:hypothetical protein